MKRVLVGAPLLGTKQKDDSIQLASWRTFAPLITDPSGVERFVLLPNSRFVSVLAYQTGKRIATILPSLDNDELPVEITAVALASTNNTSVQDLVAMDGGNDDQILMLACNDGSLRLVFLNALRSKGTNLQNCGPYWIPGECHRPQHVLQLDMVIHHMAVGYCLKQQVAVYAIAKENDAMGLFRFMVPLEKTKETKLDSSSVTCLESNLARFTYEGNPEMAFSLLACNYEKDGKDQGLENKYSCAVVMVAFPSALVMFMEKSNESGTHASTPFKWNIPSSNPLCAVAIAPNKRDIACGHSQGTIRVLADLIPSVEEYSEKMTRYEAQLATNSLVKNKKPRHPSKVIVVRKLHWHAHPVSTLAFDNIPRSAGDSMLYSGAEESVIVTWQLSRGMDKPAEVLPRVALAGIVHMVSSHRAGEDDTLLAYCADDSLQLFETHNQHLKWKVQGLGAGEGRTFLSRAPKLILDPSSRGFSNPRIMCAGLATASGSIQTYDIKQQEVVSTLRVVPFNRVSRMKSSQCLMPAPTVIHAECDAAAKTLVTVDTVPTENSAIGVSERLEDGTMIGTVSTIRFWKFNENSLLFDPSAAMASPHGPRGNISSIALSPDGKYACTISNDEKAFRLWRRTVKDNVDDWSCIYRVQFPSGYANLASGPSAVSFSKDASVLAIAFGNAVTLWDRHNVTLLTSFRHGDSDEAVETVYFMQSGELEGMLLIQSSSSISLQSPYANKGIFSNNWVWAVPTKNWAIQNTSLLSDLVSVIMVDTETKKSRVIFIDTTTGLQRNESIDMTYDDEIISAVCNVGRRDSNRWETSDMSRVALYTLCKNGEITCVTMNDDDDVDTEYTPHLQDKVSSKLAPTLEMHLAGVRPAQRPAHVLTVTDLNGVSKRQKLSIENFGAFVGEDSTVSSLPKLTGSFVRAFVSRNLMKTEQ